MWSDIDRVESKMTPKLRAEEFGVTTALDTWEECVEDFGKFSRKTNED